MKNDGRLALEPNESSESFQARGADYSKEGVKEAFQDPQQEIHELVDILDEVIKETLEQYVSVDDVNAIRFAIYDEFNHDPNVHP